MASKQRPKAPAVAGRGVPNAPLPEKQRRNRPHLATWVKVLTTFIAVGAVAAILGLVLSERGSAPSRAQTSALTSSSTPASSLATRAPASNAPPAVTTMEVAKAVMVTVQLDFGPQIPSIAEALLHIERRYSPEDGTGRTFAILDAYGEPTPDGKLHISMHVSSEKPGDAALVFKRTGEVLWQSRIVPATNAAPFSGKNLTILLDDGAGKTLVVDGSKGPATILDAGFRDNPFLVRDLWPDGAEREVTYLYSACGCPVKVVVRREGDRTVRTKEMPVIFPDDAPVVRVISRLMGW